MNRAELLAALDARLKQDRELAKSMRDEKKSYEAIAAALGMSKTAVFYLVNGRAAKTKSPIIRRPWKPGDPIPQSLRLS